MQILKDHFREYPPESTKEQRAKFAAADGTRRGRRAAAAELRRAARKAKKRAKAA